MRDVEPISFSERKAAELIAKIRRSQWADGCFADAREFMAQGYVSECALQLAWNYWGK